jgi:hypothetical protein
MKILRTTWQLRANASLFTSHTARLTADNPVSKAHCPDRSGCPVFNFGNTRDLQTTLLSRSLLRNRIRPS